MRKKPVIGAQHKAAIAGGGNGKVIQIKETMGILPRRKWEDKIIIGYCHGGMVHQPFMTSILNHAWYDGRERRMLHSVMHYKGLYVDDNRNALTRMFLSQNAEWLLLIDTDIVFPANAPYMLRDAADRKKRPIVAGLYFSRGLNENPDALPVWYVPDPNDPKRSDGFILCTKFTDGLNPIVGAGAGFLLIHRTVFDAFRGKYDNETWQWWGRDIIVMDGKRGRMGEDLTFFKRCRELGIPAFGHGGCVVDHLKLRRENMMSFTDTPNVKVYDRGLKVLPAGEISAAS